MVGNTKCNDTNTDSNNNSLINDLNNSDSSDAVTCYHLSWC